MQEGLWLTALSMNHLDTLQVKKTQWLHQAPARVSLCPSCQQNDAHILNLVIPKDFLTGFELTDQGGAFFAIQQYKIRHLSEYQVSRVHDNRSLLNQNIVKMSAFIQNGPYGLSSRRATYLAEATQTQTEFTSVTTSIATAVLINGFRLVYNMPMPIGNSIAR